MTGNPIRISYTLVSDGSRDLFLLQHIVRWVIRNVTEHSTQLNPQEADFRNHRNPPDTLSERLREAVRLFPCNMLFIHRDAERLPREARIDEIASAVEEAGISEESVSIVPVRMTEAWFLISESAIRRAAGNPNGRVPLDMPRTADLETLPNPKDMLHSMLAAASESQGRRRKMFQHRMNEHVRRLAIHIDDYSPLQCLPAFRAFEEDTQVAVKRVIGM